MVLDRGAGQYFFVLVHLYLVLTVFPFPLVSTAEFIGEFWTNKQSAMSNVAPTVKYWRYIECLIGATSLPALKGEAGRLSCAKRRSVENSQCQ
jgi:hypothetical protein